MTALLDMARAAALRRQPLRAEQLVFRPEVREMCRADRCRSYGRNWCCPPACPSLEDMARRMARLRRRCAGGDGGRHGR